MDALRLVYRRPANVVLGVTAFGVMAVFYLWSSQVLVFGWHGISVLIDPRFVAAALVMAALFGILLPLEVHALRQAIASTVSAGGTVVAALVGTASMTCCAPVVLPSLLSLVGVSGTSLLGLNGLLNRFWLPLAVLSIILLSFSLISVIRALNLECRIDWNTLDLEDDVPSNLTAVR